MKLAKLLLFSVLTFCSTFCLTAQDIHFSMFDMTPTMVNPANTGAFLGSIRLGGVYRSQWAKSNGDFSTTALYADSPVLAIGKKKRDWIGVGMTMLIDVAGKEKNNPLEPYLETTFAIPSASIHKVLDKKGNSVLTFGVQGGVVNRTFHTGGIFSEQNIASSLGGGGLSDPSQTEFNSFRGKQDDNGESVNKVNFTDFSTGIRLSSKISDETQIIIGGAVSHVVKLKNYSFAPSGGGADSTANKRPATARLHFNLNHKLNDKWSLYPAAYFQTTKGLTETVIQANLGYQFTKDLQLLGGAGFRLANAGIVTAGVNFKDWTVRMSYDVNVGKVASARLQNTFEIGAMYILKIYQEPVVDPVILCPKF